jgi:hypothetical protein
MPANFNSHGKQRRDGRHDPQKPETAPMPMRGMARKMLRIFPIGQRVTRGRTGRVLTGAP